jgi:hypothetical protein
MLFALFFTAAGYQNCMAMFQHQFFGGAAALRVE